MFCLPCSYKKIYELIFFAISIKYGIDLICFRIIKNKEIYYIENVQNETNLNDIVLCSDFQRMMLFRSIEIYAERCIDAKTLKVTFSIIK